MKNVNCANGAFFSVSSVPVFAEYNNFKIETGKSAIINNENGNIDGLVSPKYNIITNEEVANVFDEAFKGHPVESIKDHTNADGSKWYREIVFGGKYQKEVQVGDVVKTKIRVTNSYDGLSSVGYEFGSVRLVCTNGLTSFQKESTISFRHYQQEIVDQIQKTFEVGCIIVCLKFKPAEGFNSTNSRVEL
jgi:hypothetical protein